MSIVHISFGMNEPASPQLRSECSILGGLARATLPGSATPWEEYVADYDRIRDTMAQALDGFEDFNEWVRAPHGFRLAQAARDQQGPLPRGEGDPHRRPHERGRHERPWTRGVRPVDVRSFSKDGTTRAVYGYRAVHYDLPRGNAAGYMPELNLLCGIADVSTQSEQPVTKHLVVEVTPAAKS